MSKLYDKDIIPRLDKVNVDLKMKMEELSKMRVECAKLQLEFLKLYKPECLEIMEMLKEINDTGDLVQATPTH